MGCVTRLSTQPSDPPLTPVITDNAPPAGKQQPGGAGKQQASASGKVDKGGQRLAQPPQPAAIKELIVNAVGAQEDVLGCLDSQLIGGSCKDVLSLALQLAVCRLMLPGKKWRCQWPQHLAAVGDQVVGQLP